MHFKKFEYLREFEFIFEKALVLNSGAQDECFDEKKTEDQKSRDTVSLDLDPDPDPTFISKVKIKINIFCSVLFLANV
jgi:hypothetical protein